MAQRFLLPKLSVPDIEAALANEAKGVRKIAMIALAAESAVSVRIDAEMRDNMKRSQGGL